MTKPLVDPHCLCGKPHPCPNHGPFVGPHPTGRPTVNHHQFEAFCRLLWVLRKDVAPLLADEYVVTPRTQNGPT